MNRVFALPLVVLLGSLAAIAQTSADHPAVLGPVPLAPPSNCRVGFLAKQEGARPQYIQSAPHEGPGIRLRITLSDWRSVGITGARITVHGYTEGRTMPAAVSKDGDGKSFDLTLKIASGTEGSTNLRVEGFNAVTFVDLDSLTYADGTKTRFSDDARCRINASLLEALAR